MIMNEEESEKERRRLIVSRVRDYYCERLGKYTHQRISDEWYFYGLGFVRGDMTYVFGFNAGFFKKQNSQSMPYTHVGVNVLVRTNGVNPVLRTQYLKFFKHHLGDWITSHFVDYTSFRGGVGKEFPHYKPISSFHSDDQIVDYIKEGIDGIYSLYPIIAKNPDGIFNGVVCSSSPWTESIVDLATKKLGEDDYQE